MSPFKDPTMAKANRDKHRKSRLARRRKAGYDKAYHRALLDARQSAVNSLKESSGGKCSICGYDKNYSALAYHHVRPEDKKFAITGMYTSNKINHDELLNEISKCILVCFNCHQEIHNPKQQRRTL